MAKMRSLWTVCRTAALILFLSLVAGCANDPATKKKADDDPGAKKAINDDSLARQARLLRANSSDEQGTGLSPRSRSIEKDLGLDSE
jgi:hypothetical protein